MKRPGLLLSRPFAVTDIPTRGRDVRVEANAEERDRIAAEFELTALTALAGAFHLKPTRGGIRVTGEVTAQLRQVCVVSLEPFDATVSEPVDLLFAPPCDGAAQDKPMRGGEITVALEDDDPPEPLVDGRIDLGAVTLEFLALGIEPYPRKPGVELPSDGAAEEKPRSPFAVLANLGTKPSGRK